MKKLLVSGLVLAMTLSAGMAFAAPKAAKKKAADGAKKWECSVGDKKVMTASLDECMKMGGMVMNYPKPAPEKAAPAAKAKKAKAKKAQ